HRPGPIPTGTVVVSTMNGPAGTFQVDDGPWLRVGPLRRQVVSAGAHRLRIRSADGALVWDGRSEVAADGELALCWDLAAAAPCRR
ncbi:MAG: hypothetical protein ABMB14_34930, partial [Myxococcota bacterium]